VKSERLEPIDVSTGGLVQGWNRFWFTPVDACQLHRLRILCGLLFFFWLLTFVGHQEALLGLGGWLDADAYREVISRQQTPEGFDSPAPIHPWSIFYSSGTALQIAYWGSLVVLALFTLGVAPRITGVLTWVIVVSATVNPATSYDADYLMVILAFYLMIGYLLMGVMQKGTSWFERCLGPRHALFLPGLVKRQSETARSYAANFAVRLLQVHFAVIVATNGLFKLQLPEWWGGIAYWYPLHDPFRIGRADYGRLQESATVTLWFLSLMQYLVLAWQIGFPAFAWRRGRWRVVLVGGGIVGWLGCIFLLGLPLFGPIYLIGCLSYLHADAWEAIKRWIPRKETRPVRSTAITSKIKVET
jgi:hypothetical protein